MSTNFVREGNSFNHSVGSGGVEIEANSVVVEGSMAGVSVSTIEPGGSGTVALEGVWHLPARTGVVFVKGEALAWDTSLGRVIKSGAAAAGDIDNFGKAMESKLSASQSVDVRLTPDAQVLHA